MIPPMDNPSRFRLIPSALATGILVGNTFTTSFDFPAGSDSSLSKSITPEVKAKSAAYERIVFIRNHILPQSVVWVGKAN